MALKNGKLLKDGKGLKIDSDTFKQPMTVSAGFRLPEEMINGEIEFDNTGGKVCLIKWGDKIFKDNVLTPKNNHNSNIEINGADPGRAPYNFVPLNNKIAVLDSIPKRNVFSGFSGMINLKITTKSPLFIRGSDGLFAKSNDIPVIPGSTFRGLLRNTVNIVSYGKFNQFTNRTFFRRSNKIKDSDNVLLGFLTKNGEQFHITEAKQLASSGDFGEIYKTPYQYFYDEAKNVCTFSVGEFRGKCKVWAFTKCIDTINGPKIVPKKIIHEYELDESRGDEVVDILKSLNNHNISKKDGSSIGNVRIPVSMGIPVFYRCDSKGAVVSFGHSKYYRIPYTLNVSDHVIQISLFTNDYAESIFGTLRNPSKVFVEDMILNSAIIYQLPEPRTPKILSSPKPTSYQHYLVQPNHFVSPSHQNDWSTSDTPIRGFKQYWHKTGDENQCTWSEVSEKISKSNPDKINPIKADSIFKGLIRFENLNEEELGALLFSLELPDGCFHKIGFGKPLGLGSILVEIEQLEFVNRKSRYKSLFSENKWNLGIESSSFDKNKLKNLFAKDILKQIEDDSYVEELGFMSLWNTRRLALYKEMLTYEKNIKIGGINWNNRIRYMVNGAGRSGQNEFKNRPVLPMPDEVVKDKTYHRE